MTATIKLIELNGMLYFPFTHKQAKPTMLMRFYRAGDMDAIPYPFSSDHETRERQLNNLAIALFDQREWNDGFPVHSIIELPDGTIFDFDARVK
jgi:hypothetical protein